MESYEFFIVVIEMNRNSYNYIQNNVNLDNMWKEWKVFENNKRMSYLVMWSLHIYHAYSTPMGLAFLRPALAPIKSRRHPESGEIELDRPVSSRALRLLK